MKNISLPVQNITLPKRAVLSALAGALIGAALCLGGPPPIPLANWAMGILFGGPHLAYGTYLHFTEQRGNST